MNTLADVAKMIEYKKEKVEVNDSPDAIMYKLSKNAGVDEALILIYKHLNQ